jgi:hypothetical protein
LANKFQNQCGVEPIEPDDWPGVAIPPDVCPGVAIAPAAVGFFLPFVFGLCIEPPDMVLPVEPAGDAMLPLPDIVPVPAGVDGPDIDPPVWAKAAPATTVAAKVMIANAAVRVVKVFMGVPLGLAGPRGPGGCGRHRPTSMTSSGPAHDRLHWPCHWPYHFPAGRRFT